MGLYVNLGGVDGFKVDSTTGAMTRVPGAPILFGSSTQNQYSEAGPLAAIKGYVFTEYGPPNLAAPVIRSYAVDPKTGQLGNYTQVDGGAENGDNQVRQLVTDPSGHNLYAVYQNNIASFQINSDGTLSYLGTATNLATAFIQSLTVSPTGQLAFVMVDNCPPSRSGAGCVGPPDILLLNRDPNSGALSNSGKLMGQNNISDVTGPIGLAFDNTGKYLLAWTVINTSTSSSNQITVYSVDYTHQTLTPVKSYPTVGAGTVPSLSATAFVFDSTNAYVYVLESTDMNEKPEALVVYSFDQSTGGLTQVQDLQLPSGASGSALVVDETFVYVLDSMSGSTPSSIYVFQRDSGGKVGTTPVFTQNEQQQGLGAGVEMRF